MQKFVLALALLLSITATSNGQSPWVKITDEGNNVATNAPAGATLTFSVQNPGYLPIMQYEWIIINLEDNSVDYHGFDTYEVTMTPIDPRYIEVYVVCYDMMMQPIDTTASVQASWLPPTYVEPVYYEGNEGSGVSVKLNVFDSYGRPYKGQFAYDEIGLQYTSTQIAGSGWWAYASTPDMLQLLLDFPLSATNILNDPMATTGSVVTTPIVSYSMYYWSWENQEWTQGNSSSYRVRVKKIAGVGNYSTEKY